MKLRISPLFFALQKATKPLLCVDRVCRLEGGSCQSLGKGVASGRGRALQRAQTSDGANWKVWEDLGFFHPPENGRINPEKGTISIHGICTSSKRWFSGDFFGKVFQISFFCSGSMFWYSPNKGNLLSNFLRPSKGILFKNYFQRALQQFHFLMHNMRGQPACECKPSTKSVPGLEHLRFMGLAIYLKMDPLGLQIFYVRFRGVVSSKERPLVTTLGLSHHVD